MLDSINFGLNYEIQCKKNKFYHLKFKMEQIDQFDSFFMRKDIVKMSSYQTHSKSGLPIMYLQDNKQALWEKFSEEYPNEMHRTAFMTHLQGTLVEIIQFGYKSDV